MNKDLSEKLEDIKHIGTIGFRKIWEPFMRKYKCDYVCELGVFKGANFMQMIRHNPKLAVAVDTWNNDGVYSPSIQSYSEEELQSQYDTFRNLVRNLPFVRVVRENTIEAAKQFPDNFFDVVYVDADHSFEGCLNDLVTWYPKIKPGKFLAGHDYAERLRTTYGVFDAVNKFAKENKLQIARFGHSNWAVVKSR
jgi:hypothetical protein